MNTSATGRRSGLLGRVRGALTYLQEHPRLSKTVQAAVALAIVGVCAWVVADQWSQAGPRLENASLGWLAVALGVLAAYYLVFILGWIRLLAHWEIVVPYRVALQAEMVSMLAKYLPGGVWTPAARALALRRAGGVTATPVVLASILVEAGLSAISGVIVFVVSLAWVRGVHAPLPALVAFAVLLAGLLHPRIFRPVSSKLLQPFGAESIEPPPFSLTLELLIFYCGTWVLGGGALYALLRSVGANVGLATIPYLGGVAAIGAIIAVLAVFTPSGLGAREASMYGLLLPVTSSGAALSGTLLNRLAITFVELALFGVGVVAWGVRRQPRRE
jgi:glycosyltransferase 2 family protein